MRRLLPLGLTLALSMTAWAWWRIPAPFRPAPTRLAPFMDEEAEEANHEARAQWLRESHKARPGVDPAAVERRNAEDALDRHNRRAASAGTWTERGSDNQAGRMHGALLDAAGDTLYAISAGGGVWKGAPDGSSWTPIGDAIAAGGQQSIALLPGDVLLVGTDGGTVHRSDDGGATWTVPTGISGFSFLRRIVHMSDGTDTTFLVGGPHDDYGLWRSTDAGATFTQLRALGPYAGDVWVPRNGGSTIYAATGDGIQRSDDHGDTWTTVGTLPVGGPAATLVGSEAGAPTLYAVVYEGGYELLRSDDAGANWTELHPLSDYYGEVEASIVDPLLVAWGGVDLSVSHDGGETSANPNTWDEYYGDPEHLLHADMMGMNVQPDGAGERWYVGCDGGLYVSADLASFENLGLHGLRVSQYYSTLTSSANPDHIMAGAQDQGYQWTQGHTETDGVWDFEQGLSGDYGHLSSSDGTHTRVVSTYPGFILIASGEENPRLDYQYYPSGENSYAWMPPVVMDPDDTKTFYFLGAHVWQYQKDGGSWVSAQWSEQDFGDSSGEYISAMTFAPSAHDRVYVATNYGRMFSSDDHGVTWTQGESMGADAQYFYGQALVVDPLDPDTAYVAGSGYGEPGVYRTTDGGQSWDAWADGLPDTFVYSLAVLQDGTGRVFSGSETGAWMRDPASGDWTDILGSDGPVVTYWSAEVVPGENTVRFGTYGRGIWDFTLPAVDADGDGYAAGDDCDDTDATVHPGATEVCDGLDGDCDGAATGEEDTDGDGTLACEDCDDADPTAYPGAEEVCGDEVDQDCDGADVACPADTGDSGTPDDAGDPGGSKDDPAGGGCGCATTEPGVGWFGVGLGLIVVAGMRRRRG